MTRADPVGEELQAARLRFEESWGALQRAVGRETGRRPRWSMGWTVPVVALAAGLAAGWAFKSRRKRR